MMTWSIKFETARDFSFVEGSGGGVIRVYDKNEHGLTEKSRQGQIVLAAVFPKECASQV